MARFLAVLFGLVVSLVPLSSRADMLCAGRKSKDVKLMKVCRKNDRVILDLGPTHDGGSLAKIAALETRAQKLEQALASAIGTDSALGLDDLGLSVLLPFPGAAIGNNHRVVTADLDLSTKDGDPAGVSEPTGSAAWLSVEAVDDPNGFVDFRPSAKVFSAPPRCVAGLHDSIVPTAPRSLAVSVAKALDDTPIIRVRVIGPPNQLDVAGTLICVGPAGDESPVEPK